MKALLVIDIQQSYIARYDHELIQRINKRITEAHESNWDIVYIRNTKRLRNGVVTEELADELILLSENVFFKEEANAFASDELVSFLHSQSIDELEIIGVDGNSCIKASVMGALDHGFQVTVNPACVGALNQVRFDKTKTLLEARGVIFR